MNYFRVDYKLRAALTGSGYAKSETDDDILTVISSAIADIQTRHGNNILNISTTVITEQEYNEATKD